MAALVVSLVSVLGFVLAFAYLHVVALSKRAIDDAQGGLAAITDRNLSEEAKEAAVQSAGLDLLKASFQILLRLGISLGAAAAPIYAAELLNIASIETVVQLMLRWDYLLGVTAALLAAAWGWSKLKNRRAPDSAYSPADQMIHKLAFAGPGIQLTATDIEDRLFAKRIERIDALPPVFITSLPRAGTTILLTALNELPSVATHLYRDMPFVMAPLLWSRTSSMFAKQSTMAERAHGDGIEVGYDSPEAFEEVIWRTFWPEKYHDESIDLWNADDTKPEATKFFLNHFKKIIALRTEGSGHYVSKNNNNIARLDLLPTMFPNAQLVVPIREPAEHAASLLRQHKNFLTQHTEDPFVERYMSDIGHLEFGALHRPFAFAGFDPTERSPEDPDYWLDYWISAYRMTLERAERVHIVTHDKVCERPEPVMQALCERIGVSISGVDLSGHFQSIPKKTDDSLFDATKLTQARELYHALRSFEV